ncbi:hypothetical protein VIGAN_08081200, partial [Vigna angularis var. angularis]
VLFTKSLNFHHIICSHKLNFLQLYTVIKFRILVLFLLGIINFKFLILLFLMMLEWRKGILQSNSSNLIIPLS